MAAGAHGAEDLLAVLGHASWRRRRGGSRQRAQVRHDLPDLVVGEARVGRHLGARHAALDGLEQTVVAAAVGPDLGDVGTAHAGGVDAVAVAAAAAEEAHACLDGVGVALERVLGRCLCRECCGAEDAQRRSRQQWSKAGHRVVPSRVDSRSRRAPSSTPRIRW